MQTPPCHHHEGTYIQTKVCRNSSHRCHFCSVNEMKNDEEAKLVVTRKYSFSVQDMFLQPLCHFVVAFVVLTMIFMPLL